MLNTERTGRFWHPAPVDLIKDATWWKPGGRDLYPLIVPYLDAFDVLSVGGQITGRELERRYGLKRWQAQRIVKRARDDFAQWVNPAKNGHRGSQEPAKKLQNPANGSSKTLANSPDLWPSAAANHGQNPAESGRSRARYNTEHQNTLQDRGVGPTGPTSGGGYGKALEALQRINAAELVARPHLSGAGRVIRWREPHKALVEWMTGGGTPSEALLIVEHAVSQWASVDRMRPYIRQGTLFGDNRVDYLAQAEAWDAVGRPEFDADFLGGEPF